MISDDYDDQWYLGMGYAYVFPIFVLQRGITPKKPNQENWPDLVRIYRISRVFPVHNRQQGAKCNWNFPFSGLVKNPDGTDELLIVVVMIGEVRRAQLAKSTLLTSTLVPLGIFSDILRSVQMLKSGMWKATGSYLTYSSLVKL